MQGELCSMRVTVLEFIQGAKSEKVVNILGSNN